MIHIRKAQANSKEERVVQRLTRMNIFANERRPHENRIISISQTYQRQKREAEKRITTTKGILLRMERFIQVEGAIEVIKED